MYRNNYGILKAGLILTIVLQVIGLVALVVIGIMIARATIDGPFGYLMDKIDDDKFRETHEAFERGREAFESIDVGYIAIPLVFAAIVAISLAITSGALHNVKKASFTGRPINKVLCFFAGLIALGTTLIGGILVFIGMFSSPQASRYERDIPRSRRDSDRYERRRSDRWEDDRDRYEDRRSRRRYREDDYDEDDYRRPYR